MFFTFYGEENSVQEKQICCCFDPVNTLSQSMHSIHVLGYSSWIIPLALITWGMQSVLFPFNFCLYILTSDTEQ